MSKKDIEEADLPETDNPSQNSQLANSIRNQSAVTPEDYPLEKRNPAKGAPEPAGKSRTEGTKAESGSGKSQSD